MKRRGEYSWKTTKRTTGQHAATTQSPGRSKTTRTPSNGTPAASGGRSGTAGSDTGAVNGQHARPAHDGTPGQTKDPEGETENQAGVDFRRTTVRLIRLLQVHASTVGQSAQANDDCSGQVGGAARPNAIAAGPNERSERPLLLLNLPKA